jgi:hypothetical protein
MANPRITTTASIAGKPKVRCACGRLARGGATVKDGNGRFVAVCCALPRDREFLEGLIGDAAELEEVADFVRKPQTLRKNPQLPVAEVHEVLAAASDADLVPDYVSKYPDRIASPGLRRRQKGWNDPVPGGMYGVNAGLMPLGSGRGRK